MATNTTISVLDNIMTEVWEPSLRHAIVAKTKFLQRIERQTRPVHGHQFLIGLEVADAQGVGAISEDGSTPTVVSATYGQWAPAVKYVAGQFEITDQSLAATRNGGAVGGESLELTRESIERKFRKELNRMLWNDGTGKIAQVNGAISPGTSLVVDNPRPLSATNTKYTEKNMYIDVYSGSTAQISGVQVTAVTPSTNTLTIASSTCSDDAWVYRKGGYNAEPMGILGIADTTTYVDSFQGITRSTAGNEWAQCQDINVAGALTQDDMQELSDLCESESDVDEEGYEWWTTYGIRRKYGGILVAYKRFQGRDNLEGGLVTPTLEFNGRPIHVDRNCSYQCMYYLHMPSLVIYQTSTPHFLDADGSVIRKVSGKANWEGTFVWYMNLVQKDACNVHGRLRGVTET